MNASRQMFFKMITSALLRRRSRLLVALMAIVIGASLFSGLVTLYYDIPRQLSREFRSYGANFILLPAADEKLEAKHLADLENALEGQRVLGFAPYRYETAKLYQNPYLLAGTRFDQAKKNSPFWYIEGEWVQENEPNSVMIGKEVSRTLNLGLGDQLVIEGVKAGRKQEGSKLSDSASDSLAKAQSDVFYKQKFKIKGIISTGGAEEGYVFLNLDRLTELLEDELRVDSIEVSIEAKQEGLEALGKELSQRFPDVLARPVRRVTQSQDAVLGKLTALVLLVNAVVLMLTMISVMTTMLAMVTERRKEIGLKKALGASDRSILREFMGEGVGLGLVGAIVGSALGFVFAQQLSLRVFGRNIEFSFWIVPLTVVVSVLITLLASYWPVKKASKIDPALVLRGE